MSDDQYVIRLLSCLLLLLCVIVGVLCIWVRKLHEEIKIRKDIYMMQLSRNCGCKKYRG